MLNRPKIKDEDCMQSGGNLDGTEMQQRWKVRQIIAAQSGWKAVHCQESANGQVKISNRAIICWALVEAIGEDAGPRTEVRGIEHESNRLVVVGDLIKTDKEETGDGNEYFLGYNDPDAHKESDYWLEQASARLKRENDKRAKG
jgi:hypothetical protein